MQKYRIGVDIHGVMMENHTPWLQNSYIENGTVIRFSDINAWDTSGIGLDIRHLNAAAVLRARPVLLALEVFERLYAYGHELVFLSAPLNDAVSDATQRWIHTHVGPSWNVTFTHNKWDGTDIEQLIDDGLHNFPTLLMDMPYNQGNVGPKIQRTHGWNDVLLKLTGAAFSYRRHKDTIYGEYRARRFENAQYELMMNADRKLRSAFDALAMEWFLFEHRRAAAAYKARRAYENSGRTIDYEHGEGETVGE